MHDKTTPIPGKAQSYRDLSEDDKVKMMAPGIGLPKVTDPTPMQPVKEIATKTVGARLKELEEKVSSLKTENKAMRSVVAGMEEWQDCMGDIINAQTEEITKLQELLDNQTIASTDAINGLGERIENQRALVVALTQDHRCLNNLVQKILVEALKMIGPSKTQEECVQNGGQSTNGKN